MQQKYAKEKDACCQAFGEFVHEHVDEDFSLEFDLGRDRDIQQFSNWLIEGMGQTFVPAFYRNRPIGEEGSGEKE